jgi:hypothetical protein
MRNNKIIISTILLSGMLFSCKKQLDVKDPNAPTPSSVQNEAGILNLAQGGVYLNGFTYSVDAANNPTIKYYDGVLGAFFAGVLGIHEIMGDEIDDEAANEYINQIGCPYQVTLEDGTVQTNNQAPQKQPDLIRQINQNSYSYNNPLYYEWAYMYNLNNAANNVLSLVDNITFSGDADAKKNTLKAWCYWWKGYAYARLGSIYYAGIINDLPGVTNANYVSKEALIGESNSNFDKATAILSGITNTAEYTALITKLIPDIFQVGLGLPPTTAQWIKSINTYKARNILVNNTVATMTTVQWDSVLNYANAGIAQGDNVFTGRSNASSDFINYTGGTVAAKAVGDPNSDAPYIIQERLIQDFKAGDKRFTNNFIQLSSPYIYPDRGLALGTRWSLVDGGTGLAPTAVVEATREIGAYELYMATTYEENELMKAEAKIYTGDIEGGLTSIDNVRAFQGSGLAAVAGTGLGLDSAKEELRKERRIGLMFRGLSFYDARRWGVINDVSTGGGRAHAWFIDANSVFHPNTTINYNYLDYWDVPDNELAYNVPAAGSAPVKNPK